MLKRLAKSFGWLFAGMAALGMAQGAEPFTVTITNLTEGQYFGASPAVIPIQVACHDVDAAVIRVEYYNGKAKVGESLQRPFDFTWTNAPGGTNVITARAQDEYGAEAWSPPVTVVVNYSPEVTFAHPWSGALLGVGSNVTVVVNATDADGQVTMVRLYFGGELAAELAAPPYTLTLSNLALGDYSLRAVALDDRGAETSTPETPFAMVIPDPGIFDDFEPEVEPGAWQTFAGPLGVDVLANSIAGTVSGTNSLWFGGDDERYAITRPVALRAGAAVEFYLRYAGDGRESWSEIMLPEEAVQLEYSIAGSDWVVLQIFDDPALTNWQYLAVALPPEAITTNTQFRFHQPAHGGVGLAQWALDDVSVSTGATPPTILVQPQDQIVAEGGIAEFKLKVRGSPPLQYQWYSNGAVLPDATNAVLQIPKTSTSQSGSEYFVRVGNGSGSVTSAVARLLVVVPDSDNFRIISFSTNNATTIDHNNLTGDDRGGLVVSSNRVFITGDTSTAHYDAENLGRGARVGGDQGRVLDGLLANLRTETIYSLANGTNYLQQYNYTVVDGLLELNPATGMWNGNRIPLSSPININTYGCGVFSGSDRAVLWADQRLYHIALPSGVVTDLGQFSIPQYYSSESWAFWGIAECFSNSLHLVYVRDSRNIVRTTVADGTTTVLQNFSNLGDMASIGLSLRRERWYFHHESGSQFRPNGGEILGYAAVNVESVLAAPPFIVGNPNHQYVKVGGQANFSVSDAGALPRNYQWYHNGQLLPENSSLLVISNVQPANFGDYFVVIANPFGSVTSSIASLVTGNAPQILVHPTNQTVMAGTRMELVVQAQGTEPLEYQWYYEDYSWISGTNVLSVDYVSLDYTANYHVVVSNPFGAVTSKIARVTVLSPPIIASQPADVSTLPGDKAVFQVAVRGTEPFQYQWYKGGSVIAGAISNTLAIPNISADDLDLYQVVITNDYGAVTSRLAELRFVQLLPNTFRITGLYTNNSRTIDHESLTGDDRGCIAASKDYVFYSGDSRTARFHLNDLSGGSTALSQTTPYGGLVSNLRTETVYSFGTGNTLVNDGGRTITTLIELNGTNLALTGRSILLSQPITNNYGDLVCAGFNRVGLYNSNQRIYYDIQVPSGEVTIYGPMPSTNYFYIYGSETWSAWGVVEYFDGDLYIVYVGYDTFTGYPSISRTRISDWQTSTVAGFGDNYSALGDMSCLTVSILRKRWYFHHESGSVMQPNYGETIGYADASFVFVDATNAPPDIVQSPADVVAPLGGEARFDVHSYGGEPLQYQWYFNGVDLAGATNATLVITNVQAEHQGAYSVTVGNAFGRALSAAAQLTLDYGNITNYVRVFGITNSWRYNQQGTDLGTTWRTTGYTDSSWPQGMGLLAFEENPAITPQIRTTLNINGAGGTPITTYYFRTRFALPAFAGARQVNLICSNLVDDGAVFYLNGTEKNRLRMSPTATITYSSLATSSAPEGVYDQVVLEGSNLSLGGAFNTLAVEVHQQSTTSSDVVFGMALYAEVIYPNNPPVITAQPEDMEIDYLGSATFSVAATGLQPISYQWYYNGVRMPSFTGSSLTMMNVLGYQAGNYHVVASNAVGVVTSRVARLIVNQAPEIWEQPLSQEVQVGEPVTLQTYVVGSPLYFQWWQNGAPVPGGTNMVLTLEPTLPAHAGAYYLIASNALGVVTSETAVVTLRGVLWLTAGVTMTNGSFNLHFDAPPGQAYDIEASEDLSEWMRIETITNANGSVDFADPNIYSHPRRYYRLKVLP